MKVLIYGDSNTWGYVPNINGYSKNAIVHQYKQEEIWWYPLLLKHDVIVDGLCGRAINNDNPWLEGRNASKTVLKETKSIKKLDLIIIQLGTNDCKSKYDLSAEEICENMKNFINILYSKFSCDILIISPAQIKEGNKITDKYYAGAEKKSCKLSEEYKKLAKKLNIAFINGLDLEVGEDGEHLTKEGHKVLSSRVVNKLNELHCKRILGNNKK